MRPVRNTRQAEADLLDIWLYVARDNLAAAERLFDRLERRCAALARLFGRDAPNKDA